MRIILMICFLFLYAAALFSQVPNHTFAIADNEFLLDGKPIRIISGEIHFARIPKEYWRHRLQMARAMGLNTIATYVFWNYHEVQPGVWDFRSESRDIAQFVRIAQEEGLWVIIRPGPYACAEWEFGGYPWFLQKQEGLVVRSNNPAFLNSTREYINALAGQLKDLQITHGGPIVMVQIENEYGSYGNDMQYKLALKQQLQDAGFDVPFFTSDGDWLFEGGHVPGVLPTANGEDDVDTLRARVNRYNGGKGPYMVAEFYPGWLDHWAEPFEKVAKEDVVQQMEKYLKGGVSFNFYMFHGGTNFGYTSGANYNGEHDIQPDITSYDYDAPLSEAGWATPKFMLIRETIKRYVSYEIPAVPERIPVIEIPDIRLTKAVNLSDIQKDIEPAESDRPLTFEELNQGHGFVMYSRRFEDAVKGELKIDGLRDYALVYVDGKKVGTLNRYYKKYFCSVNIPENGLLEIFVENMGRINYGAEIVRNTKGIISPVTINGKEISDNWKMYRMPFEKQPDLDKYKNKYSEGSPVFYKGIFTLDKTGDTFLDMREWGKGIVFVNGHHLGRYWNVGPQQTLYLPGCRLKKGENEIIIFEMQNDVKQDQIKSLKEPILDQLNTKVVKIKAKYDPDKKACAVDMFCDDPFPTEIYYYLGGIESTIFNKRFTQTLFIDKITNISARGFQRGSWGEISSSLSIMPTKSFGKDVIIKNPCSPKYEAGGKYALVDGIMGSTNHRDGCWQGYEGADLEAVIDMESEITVKSIATHFLQNIGSWIFLPKEIQYFLSMDGTDYKSLPEITHNTEMADRKNIIVKNFTVECPETTARFIKIIAKNIGVCPAWHPGAGGKAWLFVDEFAVN